MSASFRAKRLAAASAAFAGLLAAWPIAAPVSALAKAPAPIMAWHHGFRLHQPPWSPNGITGLDCASPTFCAAADSTGDVLVATHPREGSKAWSATDLSGSELSGISCPSPQFCAIASGRLVYTSENPGAATPVWRTATTGDKYSYVASLTCTGTDFCLGTEGGEANPDYGQILVSSNPAAATPTWRLVHAGSALMTAASCPTSVFCVAAAGPKIAFSRTPEGPGSTWHAFAIEKPLVVDVSCPSSQFCAAVDNAGGLLTSWKPTSGMKAWHRTALNTTKPFFTIDCQSSRLCLATDISGSVFVSTNPTGGHAAWHMVNLGVTGPLTGFCEAADLCLVADDLGDVFNTHRPAGSRSSWLTNRVDGRLYLQDVSCPASSLCVAAAYQGLIAWSTDPTGGPTAWHTVRIDHATGDAGDLTAISCSSITFCATADWGGTIFTTTNPTGPASAWTRQTTTASSLAFGHMSCVTGLCAIEGNQQVVSSTTPATGPWNVVGLDIANPEKIYINDISCGSGELCALTGSVTGDGGRVVVSNSPTGDQSSWVPYTIGTSYLNGIWCAASFKCVAVGQSTVSETSDASGGAGAWTSYTLNTNTQQLFAVTCANVCVAAAGPYLFAAKDVSKASNWQRMTVTGSPDRVSCSGNLCATVDFSGQIIVGKTGNASGRIDSLRI